jgi:hypothetical protein
LRHFPVLEALIARPKTLDGYDEISRLTASAPESRDLVQASRLLPPALNVVKRFDRFLPAIFSQQPFRFDVQCRQQPTALGCAPGSPADLTNVDFQAMAILAVLLKE